MKSSSFYAAFILKKLWTLFAVVLVVCAVLLSIIRFSLPYAEDQTNRIENWLSNQYGVELEIGSLSANWTKNGPALVLQDVHLKQSDASPIDLMIDNTQVEIDFWGSLLAWQIKSERFELDGLIFSVNLPQIQTSETEFPIVEALENLFLTQLEHFSVRNSVVDIATENDQQLIQIQHLSWLNKGNRHQGVGLLRVVELASNSATFTLDLYGTKDNLNGAFYARGEEIDLSPWLNQLVRTQNQLTESRGNFTFWAHINKSRVDAVNIDLTKSEFTWKTPDTIVQTAIVGGDINAVPDASGWRLKIEDLILESNNESLITSWTGHIGRNGVTRINNLNPLNIRSLLPVSPLVFDRKTIEFIDQLSPTARLDELAFRFGKTFSATAKFSQLGWNQVEALPGISNLTGNAEFYDNVAHIQLGGVAGNLAVNNTFEQDLLFNQLQVNAYLQMLPRGIKLWVPELKFVSDDLSFEQAFVYDTRDGTLSLHGEVDSLSVLTAKTYLAEKYIGTETHSFLQEALVDGQIESVRVLWQGELSQFPYEKNNGNFQTSLNVSESTFKFDQNWPALTEMNIGLKFENDALYMTGDKAKLMDVTVENFNASIPNLEKGAVLIINGNAKAQSPAVTELMLASNLADSLGQVLIKGINVSGDLQTELNLNIPLTGNNVVVTGKVGLSDNSVLVPSLGLTFTQTNGQVSFVNEQVKFEGLQANLFGQPVNLDFVGKGGQGSEYFADINLSGDWHLEPLFKRYDSKMSTFLSGTTKWESTTKLSLNKDKYEYEFVLNSDLVGVKSGLPIPFNKPKDDVLTFSAKSKGDNQASTISFALGDDTTFEGILPHDTLKFSRAHLAVGSDETISMGLGFSIFANVEYAHFDEWYKTIALLIQETPKRENAVLSMPQRVYINADTMLVAGQKVEQLELVAKYSADNWLLEFNAEQIRAKVMFYSDWLNKGIDIKADFINLAKWEGETSQGYSQQSLANLPPVKFECKSCKIFGKDLGRVDFALSRSATGMKIDSLRLNNSNGILYAKGDWLISDMASSTQLQGELSSPDFGALLKGFGLDSGIKDSKANFDFDLSWNDSPHKFSLDTLNGNLDWRLSDGYLSEVSDKGSRVFSFLSLQSLVRKLSLDFRDVFAKGFFYDKMNGTMQIANGIADTRDTIVDGAAGEMEISGYTNLPTKELNYQIEFTPNVTSSLPLLVYWMVNPATAIAALAIDQVLTEAKVISNVKYSVTGTLEDPILNEIDRKSKEVVLPARAIENSPGADSQSSVSPPRGIYDERVSINSEQL